MTNLQPSSNLQRVLDEYRDNLAFRKKFKLDPLAATKEAGIELSPAEMDLIQKKFKTDPSKDEELEKRINK